MLEVTQLNQYYGSSHTLRGVSLTAKKGECLALLGRNGVGKTTLLKCLMGVLPVAQGKVVFNGRDITKLSPHARAKLGIAYVPQGRDIFARLTVEENLLMGMAVKSGRQASRIDDMVYDLFPVLKEMLARRGGDLSGGQQQQLAIARALLAMELCLWFGSQYATGLRIGPLMLLMMSAELSYLLARGWYGNRWLEASLRSHGYAPVMPGIDAA